MQCKKWSTEGFGHEVVDLVVEVDAYQLDSLTGRDYTLASLTFVQLVAGYMSHPEDTFGVHLHLMEPAYLASHSENLQGEVLHL